MAMEGFRGVALKDMSGEDLWHYFKDIIVRERESLADMIEVVGEVDERKLYEDYGWKNLFEYCVFSRRWSESMAYRRIRAARAARRFPVIYDMLEEGRIHLEGVVILHAFMDDADFEALLVRCQDRTVREIEAIVADRRRDPPLRDSIHFVGVKTTPTLPSAAGTALPLDASPDQAMPEPAPTLPPVPPVDASVAAPISEKKLVRVSFTADEELYSLLQRARQLMRPKYPDGRLEGVFGDALRLLIEEKDLGLRTEKRRLKAEARKLDRGR